MLFGNKPKQPGARREQRGDEPIGVVGPPNPGQRAFIDPDGSAVVAQVTARGPVELSLGRALELLGGLARLSRDPVSIALLLGYEAGGEVPDGPDGELLSALVTYLGPLTSELVLVGNPATLEALPDKALGTVAEHRGRIDAGDKIMVQPLGRKLDRVSISKALYYAGMRVVLCGLGTHSKLRYHAALAAPFFALQASEQRRVLRGPVEQRVAEVCLASPPHLVVVDGRRARIAGLPGEEPVSPGVLLVASDPVALDTSAVRIIASYRGRNSVKGPPAQFPGIAHAASLRLGRSTFHGVKG